MVAPDQASVAPQYEALRKAALGDPLPPACRSGLALFLRRGMWGWVRSLAMAAALQSPPRPSFADPTPTHQERAIIQVFAAMALDSNHRRV